LAVGKVDSLFLEVRRAVREHGIPLEEAIKVITTTPAAYLRLAGKGAIRVGADADLVLLDRDLEIATVLAKGQVMVDGHAVKRFGTFEQDSMENQERKKKASADKRAG
jgi:beta-aspartyl-dipeptidase (metallo-type)